MSNEVAAPVITPSANQPAAKPAAAPIAPAQTPDELTTLRARVAEQDAKLAAADKKLRVNGIEVQKVGQEKKALGAKLQAHDRMEKALKAAGVSPEVLERAKVNPEPVFRAILGDNYYDKMVELRLNGGAPTGEVLASELARTKDEIRAELKAEADEAKRAEAQAQQQRDEEAREQLATEAHAYVSKSRGEYPGFEKYAPENIAKAVARYIENEWSKTGKVLTNKEAADAVEWSDVAGRFARGEDLSAKCIEKFRPQLTKLTEKLKPATVVPASQLSDGVSRSSQVERRTLSNDLTATTPPAKRSYRTDEERMAAIKALNLDR